MWPLLAPQSKNWIGLLGTKIVVADKMFKVREKLGFRMYDVDGNGTIEPEEMSRIVHSIYAMMGPDQVKGNVTWFR